MNHKKLPLALALALAVLAPPGCAYETLEDHPCPPGGTPATYDNFGKGFFERWCNGCHSADDGARNGAPDNYVFETRDEIVAHKERIFVRAAGQNSSMPPGPDDPPFDDRETLADWLACGAK